MNVANQGALVVVVLLLDRFLPNAEAILDGIEIGSVGRQEMQIVVKLAEGRFAISSCGKRHCPSRRCISSQPPFLSFSDSIRARNS